jgi:hypothetical protein
MSFSELEAEASRRSSDLEKHPETEHLLDVPVSRFSLFVQFTYSVKY